MPEPVGYSASISEYRPLVKDFGTCLQFDGVNDYLSIGTSNPFTGSFYFSAKIKWNGLNSAYQTIFSKRDSYAADGLMFNLALLNSTGQLLIDTVTSYITTGVFLPLRKWVTLTWVHDVANSKDYIYLDAHRVSSTAIVTLGTKTDALIQIGATQSPATDVFWGKIDEIAIGTSAPSWAEVVAIHAKYNYPSPWAVMALDEASGTTATDSSGNGNNGTISGAAYKSDKVMTARSAVANRILLRGSKALYFDGSTSRVVTPFVPSATGFNIGFWVKPMERNTNQRIMTNRSGSPQEGLRVDWLVSSSRYRLWAFLDNNAAVTVNAAIDGENVTYNKYSHVAICFIPNSFKVYVNGVLVFTDTSCSVGDLLQTALCIGPLAAESILNGARFNMAEFTYQNKTTQWTQSEVTDLMYRAAIPSGASFYNFNDTSVDQNGANALTITSAAYSTDTPFKPRSSV